jgi:predicted dehydrogenase
VDLVVILTRHHLHAAQVLSALESGKHVYCEKPLATNASDLVKIAAALTAQQDPRSMLTVGFNRRFAPQSMRLREFIAGAGEPFVAHYRVNAGFLPLNHWTQDPAVGGGRIVGEACHFIDYLACLANAAPVSVNAQALPDGGRYQQDNVVLTLTFPDGSLGTVTYLANGDRSLPKERLEVFTAGRVAVLDDFRSLELIQNGRRKTFTSRLRQDKGHLAAWESFVEAISAGGPPPIPYDQLLGVTQATFAALDSLRTSQTITIHPPEVG